MVQISNGICNSEAQPFEIRTNGRLFVKIHPDENVSIVNGSVFKWLELKPQPKPDHLKSHLNKSGFKTFLDFRSLLQFAILDMALKTDHSMNKLLIPNLSAIQIHTVFKCSILFAIQMASEQLTKLLSSFHHLKSG